MRRGKAWYEAANKAPANAGLAAAAGSPPEETNSYGE